MEFAPLASMLVRFGRRIPTLFWAIWIVAVIAGTGALAMAFRPVG